MKVGFSRFEILTGTAALFLCLVFVCIFTEAAIIESETGLAALRAAQGADLYWVAVEPQGQRVVLSGAAPDEPARRRALQAAGSVPGVTAVEDRVAILGAAGACQLPVNDYLVAHPVTFRAGRAELSADGLAALAGVASLVAACEGTFEVAAHTDRRGDALINRQLSQRRAEIAARELVRQGVDPERLRPVGRGETQPVAAGTSESGRRANHRLELRMLEAPA